MIFVETPIIGAYVIETESFEDERGSFSNLWNSKQFVENGLDEKLYECNISFNKKKGTLRGLHYQIPPFEGSKLIKCIHGKIYDVILDLRPTSTSYKKWVSTELENNKMHYVPSGCAHGFQTLMDNSEILYLMSQIYSSKHTNIVKWNDEEYKIKWPENISVISTKDL